MTGSIEENPVQGRADALIARIARRSATVGVVGLGYVGLPLSIALVGAGFRVLGLDVDDAKVVTLNGGGSYINHIGPGAVRAAVDARRFEATRAFERTAELDVIVICVPTPLNINREPDLSFVAETAKAIARHLRAGQLVILESSTYPGTTAEVLIPNLEASGLSCGIDFYAGYSPEREDPGNLDFGTGTTPKVVSGAGPDALRISVAFYQTFVKQVVPVSSTGVAEAAKLLENVFRAVNIALVNEMKVVLHRMGIDVWEVIEAAKSKPFGFMPFYPGPGLGGHCIPIDPFYLTWKAREFDLSTHFIELAGEVNTSMPRFVLGELSEALSSRFRLALNGARVLVVGLAYKKNVDDIRESPALKILELLQARGAAVEFHDPYVAEIPSTRRYKALRGLRSAPFTAERLAGYDAAVIVTDHDCLDYDALMRHCRLVVDTRNAVRSRFAGRAFPNLVLA